MNLNYTSLNIWWVKKQGKKAKTLSMQCIVWLNRQSRKIFIHRKCSLKGHVINNISKTTVHILSEVLLWSISSAIWGDIISCESEIPSSLRWIVLLVNDLIVFQVLRKKSQACEVYSKCVSRYHQIKPVHEEKNACGVCYLINTFSCHYIWKKKILPKKTFRELSLFRLVKIKTQTSKL